MKKSFHFYVRKSHRYLGLIIGIQFLAWTVSGLYFSWSNLDEVHGDPQMKPVPLLSLSERLVSPDSVWRQVAGDSLVGIQLIELFGRPVYQLTYLHQQQGHAMKHVQLADARTGQLRPALTQPEAVALAQSRFAEPAQVASVEYLTETSSHHEYREQPLPAYAVTFEHPTQTTVYVAAALGTVQKFRNRPWRIFDFLWMGHTMDYQGRDNINNWLLRIFSVFGLFTVLSGFGLYVVSSRVKRRAGRTTNPKGVRSLS
jgi:hypothetical protein